VFRFDQMQVLQSDDLEWTGTFSSCYSILGDRIGISFRGLPNVTLMRVPQKYLPENKDMAVTKDFIEEKQVFPYSFIPVDLKITQEQALKDLLYLASVVRNQLHLEQISQDQVQVEAHRKLLNHTYNKFLINYQSNVQNFKTFWTIRQKGVIIFQDFNLLVLENLENFKGERADIFFKRIIPYADRNPSGVVFTEGSDLDRVHQAISVSYHLYQEVQIDKISEWTGLDYDAIEHCFHLSDLVYRDPVIENVERELTNDEAEGE